MITSCSCSESRLSRVRPVTSCGSTPAAPLKSSSSSTVKRSCNGGLPKSFYVARLRGGFRRDRETHRNTDPVISTQCCTGGLGLSRQPPPERPRRVPGQSLPRRRPRRPCRGAPAGQLSGAREGDGRSATMSPARSTLAARPKGLEAAEDVRPDLPLLLGATWQRGQSGELLPHGCGVQKPAIHVKSRCILSPLATLIACRHRGSNLLSPKKLTRARARATP